MIEIRQVVSDSWLDHRASKRLAAALSDKLWKRCRGHRGLFVTLTYDRSRYESAIALYRAQGESQHVALFLRKVARYLGVDLRGKWFCKLEFQKGGWVHFHLIILDVDRIPHAACTEMWGHGHVWLRRLSQRAVRYCTKYVAKGGALPAWLFLERPRSVKIIRVSSGFWPKPPPDDDVSEEDDDAPSLSPAEEAALPDDRGYRAAISAPIGQKLADRADAFVARDDRGRYRRGSCDLAVLLSSLLERGCGIVGRRGSWLVVDATFDDLERTLAAAASERAAMPPAAAAAIHLNTTAIPDVRSWISKWLDDWFVELCQAEAVPA